MQMTDGADGVITGVLLSGDEESTNSMFRHLATRQTSGPVELEVAIDQIVAEGEAKLAEVLEDFTSRASSS
jgi:hypothetical protein